MKNYPLKENSSTGCSNESNVSFDQSSPDNPRNGSEVSPIVTAAKGGGLSLIGATAGALLAIILQVLISRYYGPKYYGIFVTCLIVCNVLQNISALGLHKAGMRFLSIGHEMSSYKMILDVFKTVSYIPFLFGVIIAITLYAMSSFISVTCFHNPEMVAMLKLFSIALPFFALFQVTAELSRGFKTALQVLGHNYLSAGYAFLFAVIVCSFSMLMTVRNQVRNFMGPSKFHQLTARYSISTMNWKPILAYSLPLTPFGLLFICGSSMDILMLNILGSSAGVGEYAAAARWIIFFSFIVGSLNNIFGPLIAGKLGVNKMEDVRILNGAATRWMLFMTLPIAVFLMLSRDPMMLIFGEKFLHDGPTVLLILGFGSIFIALSGTGGLLFVLGGHQYAELGMLIFLVLLTILLNLLLIPTYGIIGAAFSTIISNMIVILSRILLIYRYFKIHPFSSNLVFPLATFLILAIGGLIVQSTLQTSNTLNLLLGAGSSALVLLSIIFTGLNDNDRDLFILFRNKVTNRQVSDVKTSAVT
ncbi:MAG: hypothetical protein CVU51_10435 [Deltaproteobacteria bacterium HGW-Deltaproteobacteria-1]|nr:MAG: hypothetical protein CVU51_10435 [Deltaproteobacteria bacterium HGW-Deltaproteobacteria-1]